VINPISMAKGLASRLLSINPSGTFCAASFFEANESVVSPVINSP